MLDAKPTIARIPAADTRAIRQRVLRPTQSPDELVYPGDDQATSAHFGAFSDGELVGIASVYAESRPGRAGEWRLRGMAVVPAHAGTGLGRRLFDATVEHARAAGGQSYWCNARTTAEGFYVRQGMSRVGEVFELPDIGPHVVMEMQLGGPAR